MHQIMMKLEATDLVCSGGRILINFDFDKGKIILILKKFKYKSTFWRCQMLLFFLCPYPNNYGGHGALEKYQNFGGVMPPAAPPGTATVSLPRY